MHNKGCLQAPCLNQLNWACVAGINNPLQALQAQLRAQVLAGATQNGMQGLHAAAVAAHPLQQQQQQRAQAAPASSTEAAPPQKQQLDAAAGVEDLRSLSSSQQECGSGNEMACTDADTAAGLAAS
jgi:hypothetical protein